MTVPDGYFADFASRLTASLPPLAAPAAQPERSLWLKIRPFAYLAAMFCGIWLMMQMFGMMRSSSVDLSIEDYPALMTALGDESIVKDHLCPQTDEYDLLEDLYDSGYAPDELLDPDDPGFYGDDAAEYDDLPQELDPLYSNQQ